MIREFPYRVRFRNFRLILFVCLLTGIGILLIQSAGPGYERRQAAGFILGLLSLLVFALLDYKRLLEAGWIIYLGAVLLLVLVILMGAVSGGAGRWLSLGPVRFQPSELAKILLIWFFAWFFGRKQEQMGDIRSVIAFLILGAVPVFLILEQPDLSTSIVVMWMFLCILFLAGIHGRILLYGAAFGLPAAGVLLFLVTRPNQQILNEYQYRRIMAWLSPSAWSQDSYQQRNSIMAFASGGLSGKGLGTDSTLSVKNGNFLPEPHTDFIMAVAGEELGFLGCILILLLLFLITAECIWIGFRSRDLRGKLICGGMAALISGQAFVNLCVVTGLMPNTGLTLPFVSYGLTSLVSLYMGIGVVVNVGLERTGRDRVFLQS